MALVEYPSAIDFVSLENADRQKANARFQTGLNSGYDEATAAALYLAPVDAKWKIIKSNPTEFQDPTKLAKINDDFEQATASAVRNTTRTTSAAEAITQRVAPLAAGWSSVGASPVLTADKAADLKNIQNEINRLSREKSYYGKQATMQTDPVKQQAAKDALDRVNGLLEEAKSEQKSFFSSGAAASPTQVPAGIPAASALTMPTSSSDFMWGTPPDSGIQLPAPAPFVPPSMPAAPQAEAKKPIMFISGRPDLSNVTREEADAAWASRFPVTGADVTAADSLLRGAAQQMTQSGIPPAKPAKKYSTVIREKATGKRFIYRGKPADIPTDIYEIVSQ